MNRIALLVPALVAPFVVAGCNGSSGSSRGTTAAAVTTAVISTITTPVSTPVSDVHGELVSVPTLAGGQTLAFQPDGAAAPYEVADPAALAAAGLHEGFTLVVSGEVRGNAGGRSALVERASLTSFQADDLVSGGRLSSAYPGLAFEDVRRRAYVPDGPLAASLLQAPLDRPLYVTGRVDTSRPATPTGSFLIVTSWRPAVSVSLTDQRPLIGSDSISIDDLERTGAHRVDNGEVSFNVPSGFETTRGSARRMSSSSLADLQGRVARADLRSQPRTFLPPGRPYPDHPTTSLQLADAQGDVSITIFAGAAVPPEVEALVQALKAVPATVATVRSIDQGDTSQITTAGIEVARDDNAWAHLWARHVFPARPAVPAVDFRSELGLGVFDGQRRSGGYAIEVTDVVKIGPHLHLTIERTSPGAIATTVITAPYHFVALNAAGALNPTVYADGARLP